VGGAETCGSVEGPEPAHGIVALFDAAMILFDPVIPVPTGAMTHVGAERRSAPHGGRSHDHRWSPSPAPRPLPSAHRQRTSWPRPCPASCSASSRPGCRRSHWLYRGSTSSLSPSRPSHPRATCDLLCPAAWPSTVRCGGTRLVWIVWPSAHHVDVWRHDHPSGPVRTLNAGDDLDGEDVIPGFTHPLADIFAGPLG